MNGTNQNLTALMSCFIRAYHEHTNEGEWVYRDPLARQLLSEQEYHDMEKCLQDGISFFCPGFQGDSMEAAAFAVNQRLAPSVLARSAFQERHLQNECRLGMTQYILLGAGYDTSGYKLSPSIQVFELDRPEIVADKKKRVCRANINQEHVTYIGCDLTQPHWETHLLKTSFSKRKKTHCSLLGLTYYLKREAFIQLLCTISQLMPGGSTLVLDYPNGQKTTYEKTVQELAHAAGETMQAVYTEREMEHIAEACGFHMYETIGKKEAERDYFVRYNLRHPEQRMTAPPGICYCLMVKDAVHREEKIY